MKKYIVYITYYKGNKLPPWYIGSSYEEKIINGYNGSVKSKKYKEIYNKEQKENKYLFKTRILSYHETREEAFKEELRLQKKHLVVKSKKYFNESYAQVNGFFGRDISGELHPMYGKKHSKISLIESANKRRGYRHTTLAKGKISDFQKNRERTKDSSLKISESNKGIKHHSFEGWYILNGTKYTSKELEKLLGITRKMIIKYCKNNLTIINKQSYGTSKYLRKNFKEDIIGKTYRDLGFGFLKKET